MKPTDHDDDDRRDGLDSRDAALMRRAKAAFDAEAAALDEPTTRRIASARRAALAELTVSARRAPPAWLPVAAAATVAAIAVGIALTLRGPGANRSTVPDMAAMDARTAAAPRPAGTDLPTEMEVALDGDDLALYAEDPEFLEWAVVTTGADDEG